MAHQSQQALSVVRADPVSACKHILVGARFGPYDDERKYAACEQVNVGANPNELENSCKKDTSPPARLPVAPSPFA